MPSTCPPTDPRYTFCGSDYGPRPGRTTGEVGWHAGLDFNLLARDPALPDLGGMYGYPVFSVADGIVVFTAADRAAPGAPAWTRGYGNVVVVAHNAWNDAPGGTWFSLYAHLLDMRVRTGQRVNVGEQIARVGATSNDQFDGMGAHLHFEIRCLPVTPNPQAAAGQIIPSANDSAFLDWQVGRRSFQTRRRPSGTTVDPIWWFEQRGVRILRRSEGDSETHRKGRIFGGTGPLGQAMMPRGPVQNYQRAALPAGASYGRMSARVTEGGSGMGALMREVAGLEGAAGLLGADGLGAQPPDEVRVTTGGQTQVLVADMSDLPYQSPTPNSTANELIPVTDPETQTPPAALAVALAGATGAIIAGTVLLTALDAKRVASRA